MVTERHIRKGVQCEYCAAPQVPARRSSRVPIYRGVRPGSKPCQRLEVTNDGHLELAYSEINQLRSTKLGHHEIRRLHVSMDDPTIVRVRQRTKNREADFRREIVPASFPPKPRHDLV